jgi:pimeloyl-ACP methyl ester carboxylesterase
MNASASMAQQRHADSPGRSRENSLASGHIRNRTVHANGLDFPILEAGHGPLVLCLHGFPDHAQSWIPFLDRLEREGYWAVAPALRGYWVGGAAPDGSYRALATGQDVLALIESLGAEQAVLVGHDLGARAAYAAASLDAGRVRKLVGLAVPYGKGLASAFVADGDQQRRSWYMFFFQTRLAEIAVQLKRLCIPRPPVAGMVTGLCAASSGSIFTQRGLCPARRPHADSGLLSAVVRPAIRRGSASSRGSRDWPNYGPVALSSWGRRRLHLRPA